LPYTANLRPALTGNPSFSLVFQPKIEQTVNCKAIPAFQSCGLNVVFSPGKAGLLSATLNLNFVNAPAPVPPAAVSLQGLAKMPPVLVSTSLLQFTTAVGSPSTKIVAVTNNSPATIHLNPSISLASNDHPKAYVVGQTCGAIGPGKTCSIQVTYSPRNTYSEETGHLLLNSTDAPAGTQSKVLLEGWGTISRTFVNPWQATFQTNIGTFEPQLIQIANDYPTTIQLHPTVSGDPSFNITQNCTSIPAHQSCSIEVTFSPKAVGQFSGNLNFNYVGSIVTPVDKTTLSGTATP
jgi:Abnormal spindle-like microcephaly-assoc'd, ASPM-SPD-2-Hydin